MLVFDVELFSVQAVPRPPPVPEDVAGPPADAEVSSTVSASILPFGASCSFAAGLILLSVSRALQVRYLRLAVAPPSQVQAALLL